MQESRKGFVTFVVQKNPNVLVVQWMIWREAFAFRFLPKDLMFALDQVITIVNLFYSKSRPLASPLFSQFCEAMESNYKCLLNHTNVPWLSGGKVLKCVVQLKSEMISLLEAEKKTLNFLFMTKSGGLR